MLSCKVIHEVTIVFIVTNLHLHDVLPGLCGAERADDGQEPGDAVEGNRSLDQV